MKTPPQSIIDAAVQAANASPCAKSQRGVVIWSSFAEPLLLSAGRNAQPTPFACDSSDACRAACGRLCEHAEAAALRNLGGLLGFGFEMAHVKTVDGVLVASGPPSCSDCSKAILADGRISGMWLYQDDGWHRYTVVEFHTLSLQANKLPVLRGQS